MPCASRRPCRRWRRAAADARRASARASSRPAAQVPPSSTQASGICPASTPSRARTSGASSSSSATVSARHSTTSSSLASQVRAAHAGSRRRSTPLSSSRPPLRYSGRPVSASRPSHVHAGPFERLEQRVGQPLRQLVERHPAVGEAGPAHGVVAPAVAERHVAQWLLAAGQIPDSDARICDRMSCAAIRCARRPDQRRTGRRAGRARRTPRAATPAPRPAGAAGSTRPSRPTSGLPRYLERLRQPVRAQVAQAGGVDLQRMRPRRRRTPAA